MAWQNNEPLSQKQNSSFIHLSHWQSGVRHKLKPICMIECRRNYYDVSSIGHLCVERSTVMRRLCSTNQYHLLLLLLLQSQIITKMIVIKIKTNTWLIISTVVVVLKINIVENRPSNNSKMTSFDISKIITFVETRTWIRQTTDLTKIIEHQRTTLKEEWMEIIITKSNKNNYNTCKNKLYRGHIDTATWLYMSYNST